MQELGDTQVKFREFHFKIPCDRIDLIDMANLIAQKAKEFENSAKMSEKEEIEKFLSFAGSQNGKLKHKNRYAHLEFFMRDKYGVYSFEKRYFSKKQMSELYAFLYNFLNIQRNHNYHAEKIAYKKELKIYEEQKADYDKYSQYEDNYGIIHSGPPLKPKLPKRLKTIQEAKKGKWLI